MSPRPIGIVGGAGPLAGVYLLDRIFSLSQAQYGCFRGKDYPLVLLVSFPFSDMLSSDRDSKQIEEELSQAITKLREQGAELIAIACNTLHSFIVTYPQELISLPRTIAESLKEPPLVLCTSTSREYQIHKKDFDCTYPDLYVQKEIDTIIDRTLKGEDAFSTLQSIIASEKASSILLGCTELSLYNKRLNDKKVIDPLEILAEKLLRESFICT